MRDINRIPKILDDLKEIWLCYPDIRFGQLLVSLSYAKRKNISLNRENVIYYEEDEDFLKFLQEFDKFDVDS